MFAAGYLEGYITQEYIYDAYWNFIKGEFTRSIPQEVFDFVSAQRT